MIDYGIEKQSIWYTYLKNNEIKIYLVIICLGYLLSKVEKVINCKDGYLCYQ